VLVCILWATLCHQMVVTQGNRVKKSCGNETCEEIVVP
jgi:hypothetical protein